jgi:hypothetical protein
MGSDYLPFAVFVPAGFSRDRPAASSANAAPTTPCLVWLASLPPHAAVSGGSSSHRFHVPASGSFRHRSNTPDSWGTRTGRKGGDRIGTEFAG